MSAELKTNRCVFGHAVLRGAAFIPSKQTNEALSLLLWRVYCCRRDVTDVFEAFHREPRHRQKLEVFRVGTLVGYTPSPLVEDFRALKDEIEEEGLFEVRRRQGENKAVTY